MQPKPMAETSRLLFPSLRFCISFSFREVAAGPLRQPSRPRPKSNASNALTDYLQGVSATSK
jgi:hypothetical protein